MTAFCTAGAIQYMVILPSCAIITFVAAYAGVYEGAMWYTVGCCLHIHVIYVGWRLAVPLL
jgi:hypothetical protein